MELEEIKNNYASLSDKDIELLIKDNIWSLAPERVEILKEEINKRNLNPELLDEIEIHSKELTEDELRQIVQKIKNLPCPECKERKGPLQARTIRSVFSVILMTNYERQAFISCESCGKSKKTYGLVKSIFLGWWGFPWGIIRTLQVIILALLDLRNKEEKSEALLAGFSIENLLTIRQLKHDDADLLFHIYQRNRNR